MELVLMAGQEGKDLRRFYEMSYGWGPQWLWPIAAMRDLVVYLEEQVNFAPVVVNTSHADLVFAAQGDNVRVLPLWEIHEGPAGSRYEIRRRADAPWSHTVGYAGTVEQAWQMIKVVLSTATGPAD